MGKFGDISLTYKERFVILFSLNNLPSHDMKTAQMFRDLEEPLRFEEIAKFNDKEDEEEEDCVVDFATAPQFLIIIPNVLRIFFTRFGFPPPVAQEALMLIDRLDAMASVDDGPKRPPPTPEDPNVPPEPESEEAEEQATEDVSDA